jgi:hypothetical protein
MQMSCDHYPAMAELLGIRDEHFMEILSNHGDD